MTLTRAVTAILTTLVTGAVLALTGPGAPAHAARVDRADPQPGCSQLPALDLRSAVLDHRADRFVARARIARLSKQRTQVLASYVVRERNEVVFEVQLRSRFVAGERVTRGTWIDHRLARRGVFEDGVRAAWDWKRRTVTLTLTRFLHDGPVDAGVFTVPKGVPHGPPCGDSVTVRNLPRG